MLGSKPTRRYCRYCGSSVTRSSSQSGSFHCARFCKPRTIFIIRNRQRNKLGTGGEQGDYGVMPNCPNCGREIQGGMRFCPNCGQDQSVVVPQDQRISTEDVPVPPPSGSSRGGGRRK